VSDIVWGVEVCEGREVGVMVMMVWCSFYFDKLHIERYEQ
jgi:hypothetical protein